MELSSKFFKEILDKLDERVYFVDRDRRIAYWSQGAERTAGYKRHEVVGTRCNENILMHVGKDGNNLCEGSCPLVKCMSEEIATEAEVFLHHKTVTGFRWRFG